MKNIKKLVACALILISTTATIGCSKTTKPTSTELTTTTVLAELDGEKILLSDVDKEIAALIQSYKEQQGEDLNDVALKDINNARVSTLDQLIQEKILLKKAKELKLMPTKEELNKKVEENIQSFIQYYGSEDKLNEAKKLNGYTDESFNKFIENQVIQQIVLEEITKDITVSEKEIKEFYDKNKAIYFTQNEGAKALHILFKTEKDAKEAKAKIDSGKTTFDKLFKQYTETEKATEVGDDNKQNTITYPKAEDLGFVEYEEPYFDKDFLAGMKKVKKGEISQPVKSSFGYHLIFVSEISNEKVVTPLKDVKDSIKAQLEYEKELELVNKKITEWQSEYKLKVTADSIGYKSEENKSEDK